MTKQMKKLAGALASIGVAATLVHPTNIVKEDSHTETSKKLLELNEGSNHSSNLDNKNQRL